jgi:ADP-heptose:LPS heptosyltransferase
LWASGKKITGLHLSKKWLTGPWATSDIADLVRALASQGDDTSVLVTYGAMEKELGKEIAERMRHEKRVKVMGELPFKKWAALIGRCHVFLSTDTGALHCAVAMKVPVLAVYEESSFNHCSRQWAPWNNPGVVLKKDMPAATIAVLAGGARSFLDMPAGTGCKE